LILKSAQARCASQLTRKLVHCKNDSNEYAHKDFQGHHERQNQGLAWILQNRMRQQWYVDDVAATVAVLPAKDPPWQP
jgi:hypothetical protein